jgi:hypothetical protein
MMRAGTILGLVLIAPAAIAAATLAVFLGAGLLIVIAGPTPGHAPPHARSLRPTLTPRGPRPPAAAHRRRDP